jgi:uncharacterized membrane protein YkoI
MEEDMIRSTTLAVAGALLLALPGLAAAQGTTGTGTTKIDPKLAAEAKITLDSARVIALGKVPRGTIASEELEREHNRLIYSFDVKVPGKSGIQEVNVNALNGAVIGVHHEGAAAERKEAAADKAAAKKDSSRSAKP